MKNIVKNYNKRVRAIYSNDIIIDNRRSLTGGDLRGKNIVVISNDSNILEKYKKIIDIEGGYTNLLLLSHILKKEGLETQQLKKLFCKNLFGTIDVIINDIFSEHNDDLVKIKEYHDFLTEIYQLLQEESNFLVTEGKQAHLVNVCEINGKGEDNTIANFFNTITKGLAYALGSHGIIVNGIIANEGLLTDESRRISLYLASRFGECLCGEVIQLKSDYGAKKICSEKK